MSVLEEISSDTLVFLQVGICGFQIKMKPNNVSEEAVDQMQLYHRSFEFIHRKMGLLEFNQTFL